MSSCQPLLDAAGRRRSPVTMAGFVSGQLRATRAHGCPADPPTVDEIVAVMRQAEDGRHGHRLNALIVVLWRAGLRIQEALSLTETDLDARRGSIWLVTARAIAGARSGWTPGHGRRSSHGWLTARSFRGRAAVLRDRRTDSRPRVVSQRGADRASPPRAYGRRPATDGAAPAAPCARRRAAAQSIPLPLIQRQLGHSHLSTTGTYLQGSTPKRSSPRSTRGARR